METPPSLPSPASPPPLYQVTSNVCMYLFRSSRSLSPQFIHRNHYPFYDANEQATANWKSTANAIEYGQREQIKDCAGREVGGDTYKNTLFKRFLRLITIFLSPHYLDESIMFCCRLFSWPLCGVGLYHQNQSIFVVFRMTIKITNRLLM